MKKETIELMKEKEQEKLTGYSPEATQILDAFGVKDSGVRRIVFDLASGELATLKVYKEVCTNELNIRELKQIIDEYELVKKKKD